MRHLSLVRMSMFSDRENRLIGFAEELRDKKTTDNAKDSAEGKDTASPETKSEKQLAQLKTMQQRIEDLARSASPKDKERLDDLTKALTGKQQEIEEAIKGKKTTSEALDKYLNNIESSLYVHSNGKRAINTSMEALKTAQEQEVEQGKKDALLGIKFLPQAINIEPSMSSEKMIQVIIQDLENASTTQLGNAIENKLPILFSTDRSGAYLKDGNVYLRFNNNLLFANFNQAIKNDPIQACKKLEKAFRRLKTR